MIDFRPEALSNKDNYERLLREAETDHLIKQIKANTPKTPNPLLAKCGDLLIATGQRLKAESATL